MRRNLFLTLIIAVTLISCDCYVSVQGKVVSTQTGEPLSNVKASMIDRGISEKTNITGYFEIWDQTGFCYDPEIEIKQDGFKPFKMKISEQANGISYTISSEHQDIHFETPFYPNPADRKTFILGTSIQRYSQKFSLEADTIIIYLDELNTEKEINLIKENLRKGE